MEGNAQEPWTTMLKREERTRRFWCYANALGYQDKDLGQPSDSEHDEGRQDVDPHIARSRRFCETGWYSTPQ